MAHRMLSEAGGCHREYEKCKIINNPNEQPQNNRLQMWAGVVPTLEELSAQGG